MQKILSFILSIVMIFSSSIAGIISGEISPKDFLDEVKMEFVEKFSDGVGISKRVFSVFMSDSVSFGEAKKLAKEIGGEMVGYSSILNECKIFINKDISDLEEFCDHLQENEKIILAVPQIVFNISSCIRKSFEYIPNDPWEGDDHWSEDVPNGLNWHLEAIQALSAWQYRDKMSTIDLGVVDSGFDVNHEDLAGKIVFPGKYFERTNRPDSHGTHVSGIICANADNGIGISGVCPNSVLHCVDWEPEYNSLSQNWLDIERIYSGLYYTVKDGAKVVNFSLGSDMNNVLTRYPDFVIDVVGRFSSAYMAVLIKHGYDFIVCQAAGNGNNFGYAVNAENNLTFCSINENNCSSELFGVRKSEVLDRIIVVGAAALSAEGYYQPAYSNVGDRVDIVAPGNDIFSTDIAENGHYGFMTGTSMAAPVVTGVCGLVWSIDSSFTGPMVKKIVCSPETAGPVVKATDIKRYENVNYKDYNLVNAKLSVEKAIQISENK